jgi:dTDP-4-dehydrorhamnose reductase
MIKILVTGSNGQLGSELREIAGKYPYFSFIFTDIEELDITDSEKVERFIGEHRPDVIINCAAYTAVDKAEDEPEKAMWLNRDAVSNLAGASDKYNCFLVQISTDFVFDGENTKPYTEDDIPCPMSVYGLSKLDGEEAMMACLQKGLIIRTSWLYSSFGHNFVKTILKKGSETGSLNVVDDQMGSPTYARDLAKAILDILPAAMSSNQVDLFHFSNEGSCSWYEFAKEIIRLASINCQVSPDKTGIYPAKAKRPAYSVLDKSLIKERFGIEIPLWQDSLKHCMEAWRQGSGEAGKQG